MAQSKESLQPNSPTSNLTPQTSISLSHHQRRCSICRHPDRYWIEEDILRWRNSIEIESDYDLTDRSTIYRHARAFGLLALRKRNLRAALEHVIERAEDVQHTIITHTTAPAPPSAAHTPSSLKHPVYPASPPSQIATKRN